MFKYCSMPNALYNYLSMTNHYNTVDFSLFVLKVRKKALYLILISVLFVLGNRSTSVEISLPTSGCGIRSEVQPDGSLELSVRLIIQMDEKLRQRSDLERVVRCNLPDRMMEMNIGMTEDRKITR